MQTQSRLRHVRQLPRVLSATLFAWYALALAHPVMAASGIPKIAPPTKGVDDDNFLKTFFNYVADGFLYAGYALAAAVVMGVAHHIWVIFHETKMKQKTMSDLGLHSVVGIIIIAAVIFMVTKATDVWG